MQRTLAPIKRRTYYLVAGATTICRYLSLALLFCILGTFFGGCQRKLPPELPYDREASETLKNDFDEFLDAGAP